MKLADLNISNDACGPYVINIYGNDRSSFIIRNNGLYFKDNVVLDSRVKNNYSIIIAVEDFSKRFPPLTRAYSINIINCPSPTTTTTTTTIAPSNVCVGNLILNGEFELGAEGSAGGGGSATNWTGVNVDIHSLSYTNPSQPRKRFVDLNSTTAGMISQTFSTIIGRTYQVSFNYSANNASNLGVKTADVTIISPFSSYAEIVYNETYNFDSTGTTYGTYESMNWQTKIFTFIATNTTTRIRFNSLSSGAFGPAIDNVCIVPVAVTTTTTTLDPNCSNCPDMCYFISSSTVEVAIGMSSQARVIGSLAHNLQKIGVKYGGPALIISNPNQTFGTFVVGEIVQFGTININNIFFPSSSAVITSIAINPTFGTLAYMTCPTRITTTTTTVTTPVPTTTTTTSTTSTTTSTTSTTSTTTSTTTTTTTSTTSTTSTTTTSTTTSTTSTTTTSTTTTNTTTTTTPAPTTTTTTTTTATPTTDCDSACRSDPTYTYYAGDPEPYGGCIGNDVLRTYIINGVSTRCCCAIY